MPPWLRPASKRDSYCRAVNEVGRAVRVVAFERLQVHATLQCLQFVRVTNSQSRACGLGVHQMQGAVVVASDVKEIGLSWRHYSEAGTGCARRRAEPLSLIDYISSSMSQISS